MTSTLSFNIRYRQMICKQILYDVSKCFVPCSFVSGPDAISDYSLDHRDLTMRCIQQLNVTKSVRLTDFTCAFKNSILTNHNSFFYYNNYIFTIQVGKHSLTHWTA